MVSMTRKMVTWPTSSHHHHQRHKQPPPPPTARTHPPTGPSPTHAHSNNLHTAQHRTASKSPPPPYLLHGQHPAHSRQVHHCGVEHHQRGARAPAVVPRAEQLGVGLAHQRQLALRGTTRPDSVARHSRMKASTSTSTSASVGCTANSVARAVHTVWSLYLPHTFPHVPQPPSLPAIAPPSHYSHAPPPAVTTRRPPTASHTPSAEGCPPRHHPPRPCSPASASLAPPPPPGRPGHLRRTGLGPMRRWRPRGHQGWWGRRGGPAARGRR